MLLAVSSWGAVPSARAALDVSSDEMRTDYEPDAALPNGYVWCAAEGANCACQGEVIWGNRGGYTPPFEVQGCVDCGSNELPTSIQGPKQCYCRGNTTRDYTFRNCLPKWEVAKEWGFGTCKGTVYFGSYLGGYVSAKSDGSKFRCATTMYRWGASIALFPHSEYPEGIPRGDKHCLCQPHDVAFWPPVPPSPPSPSPPPPAPSPPITPTPAKRVEPSPSPSPQPAHELVANVAELQPAALANGTAKGGVEDATATHEPSMMERFETWIGGAIYAR